ncbi:MAG: carboxylating nicotinate-nucleotide diphosphorylase [Rhizobiales bacterium]|nr:carboxylating nicotinate-nucleotide diphosphorylase [Hyphomicrobiales bacterium]
MRDLPVLNPLIVETAVRAALLEDFGRAGDVTSQATIPADAQARAAFGARKAGVISGLDAARATFRIVDPAVTFEAHAQDGDVVAPGAKIAHVAGNARALLAAERVALNFLGRMSGVATLTHRYAQAVAHTRAKICCTRKTTPGMRAFEKYAVRCGGGMNHRFGLDDAVLIKDNHVAVAGGVAPALRAAKRHAGHLVKIEIEVDRLSQLDEVIGEGADVVMLDNMSLDDMREAVRRVAGRMKVEASGGVNLDTVKAIAETGVDLISVGALTHSASVLDLGLDIEIG